MADEFFRPYFAIGVWAQGEPFAGLLVQRDDRQQQQRPRHQSDAARSQLQHRRIGVVDADDQGVRPEAARYGDWEHHDKLATRFGFSLRISPEQRYTNSRPAPGNTTLRLADSVNVFDTGALAPGVTVDTVDYRDALDRRRR